jgi:hypothetical protein
VLKLYLVEPSVKTGVEKLSLKEDLRVKKKLERKERPV